MAGCDPARIAQVLNNLVSNAIKYSPEGGAVRIAARAEPGNAVLEVEDSGIGIPDGELASMFQPFRRSSFAVEDIPGVGLGLFTSRQIVEGHGGQLMVESAPGRGSRFRVVLPSCDERLGHETAEACRRRAIDLKRRHSTSRG